MLEVGQKLKTRREELGLTLQEASLSLKINTRVLEAIEENRVDQLPPRTFLRGFIQSYATYLRMDSGELLDSFQVTPPRTTVAEITDSEATSETSAPLTDRPSKTSSSLDLMQPKSKTSSVLVGIFAVVLVVAIFGLLRTIEKYQTESLRQPVDGVESIPDNSAATTDAPSASTVDSTTSAAATPTAPTTTPTNTEAQAPAPAPPPTASTAAATAPASATPPATLTTPPPAPKTTTQAAPQPPAPAPPQTTPPATTATATTANSAPTTEVKQDSPQEVILEALDKVTVEYQIDDETRQKVELKAEELRTLKARRSLFIRISDGGAVSLVHNGRDRGVPGNIGQPVTLNFPRKTQ